MFNDWNFIKMARNMIGRKQTERLFPTYNGKLARNKHNNHKADPYKKTLRKRQKAARRNNR